MTMRYGKRDVAACFDRLVKVLNMRKAKDWRDSGGWTLDCNYVYGGWVVHQYVGTGGGVSCPLGDMRRSARDFCQMVWDIEKAARILGVTR